MFFMCCFFGGLIFLLSVRWLVNSYNKFDREFTFKDRILLRLDEYENTKSYFATMINESNSLELKEGDLIKWKVDAKQQDSYIIIGKIKDFVVNQQLPALEVFFIFSIINYFIRAYTYCCISISTDLLLRKW